MNILADFETAIQSIDRINNALKDFKLKVLEVSFFYNEAFHDEEKLELYLEKLKSAFQNYSTKEMFLLIALFSDEKKLSNALDSFDSSEIHINELIEKTLILKNS